MWILPRPLHTSDYVPDTEALNLDSNELSEICARSLFVRSKPSPARTWSQKWRRDSWTALLFGRILRPSHGPSFVTAWTSSLVATPASPSAQPENDSAPKTHDTSGHTSSDQYLLFDLDSAFLKMSKDTSRWDSPASSAIWKSWVTRCRGEYSLRVKSAHLTSASGCSSWPTASVMDTTGGSYKTEWKDGRAVSYHNHTQENPVAYGAKLADAVKYGQAAPASSSSLGSRQGLWPTARSLDGSVSESLETWTARRDRKEAEGINLHRPLPIAVMQEQQKQWATPQASDPEHSGPNQRDSSGRPALPAQAMQWATPRSGKTTDENPETWALRQAKGEVATMPLTAQVKCWGTPTARDHKSGRGNEERDYKELTPMVERTQAGKLNPRWVETLMGLPVGWTMPSCIRPVTIARTNCDSSATESCLPPQSELF